MQDYAAVSFFQWVNTTRNIDINSKKLRLYSNPLMNYYKCIQLTPKTTNYVFMYICTMKIAI